MHVITDSCISLATITVFNTCISISCQLHSSLAWELRKKWQHILLVLCDPCSWLLLRAFTMHKKLVKTEEKLVASPMTPCPPSVLGFHELFSLIGNFSKTQKTGKVGKCLLLYQYFINENTLTQRRWSILPQDSELARSELRIWTWNHLNPWSVLALTTYTQLFTNKSGFFSNSPEGFCASS